MNFLDKLNILMQENGLNKSTLSKACQIPYTTIDGWYKKGYEGLKLSTLRKLSRYFGTTLDYWVEDAPQEDSSSALAAVESVENEKGPVQVVPGDREEELAALINDAAQLTDDNRRDAAKYVRYLLYAQQGFLDHEELQRQILESERDQILHSHTRRR